MYTLELRSADDDGAVEIPSDAEQIQVITTTDEYGRPQVAVLRGESP
jgi:hypothetical protein